MSENEAISPEKDREEIASELRASGKEKLTGVALLLEGSVDGTTGKPLSPPPMPDFLKARVRETYGDEKPAAESDEKASLMQRLAAFIQGRPSYAFGGVAAVAMGVLALTAIMNRSSSPDTFRGSTGEAVASSATIVIFTGTAPTDAIAGIDPASVRVAADQDTLATMLAAEAGNARIVVSADGKELSGYAAGEDRAQVVLARAADQPLVDSILETASRLRQ